MDAVTTRVVLWIYRWYCKVVLVPIVVKVSVQVDTIAKTVACAKILAAVSIGLQVQSVGVHIDKGNHHQASRLGDYFWTLCHSFVERISSVRPSQLLHALTPTTTGQIGIARYSDVEFR